MNKVNVIDFDNTLIPFDSFRVFVKKEIKRFRFSFIIYTILRICRILKASTYKKAIINSVLKSNIDSFNIPEFTNYLVENIDSDILNLIQKKTDSQTNNVLCSASPLFYISKVADQIGWMGFGSYFNEKNEFVHLYGINKNEFIIDKFPRSAYTYNYSISDSKSDLQLLELFNEYKLLE